MAFYVVKQERETNLSLVRRFTKRIKESGILKNAKKAMFTKREMGKTRKKITALRRIAKKREFEKLAKLGKI